MKYSGRALLVVLVLASAAVWPGSVAAQEQTAEAACGEGEFIVADYGFSGLECNCAFSVFADGRRRWSFRSEPEVRGVKDGSPADGVIERGDIITAIDGLLITTREAGERFATVKPGEEVTFTVRRGDRVSKVQVVAGFSCERVTRRHDRIEVELVPRPDRPPRPDPAPRVAVDLAVAHRIAVRAFPGGWFGFGISCNCVIRQGSADEPSVWEFNEPPEIYSVEPGSPAAAAGLRRGDVLLEIDGVELTADEGGRRFGAVEPGQEVRFTYRRGGETRSVTITAGLRRAVPITPPPPTDVAEPLDVAVPIDVEVAENLRYAGTVGDVDVEVRGANTVIVRVIEEGKEVEIISADSRIRLRLRQ